MYRLNPEQEIIVSRAREVADRAIAPHAGRVDAEGVFPREAMGALGEAASFVAITVLFFRFLDREGAEAPRPGSLDVPGNS